MPRHLVAVAAAALSVAALLVAPASAQTLHCGDTVATDTVLTTDLTGCNPVGLTIGADDVTLDLNGHTITGVNGSGVGITMAARQRVTVENGTVRSFRIDLNVARSADVTVRGMALNEGHDGISFFDVDRGVIAGNSFTGNDGSALFPEGSADVSIVGNRAWANAAGFTAVDLTGATVEDNFVSGQTYYGLFFIDVTGTTLSGNSFERNGTWGMQVNGESSSGNLLSRNDVDRNGSDGILLADSATATLLERNRTWRNGGDGIDVQAPGATLTRNSAFFNGGFGIEAGAPVTDGGGNHAKQNRGPVQCAGIQCK